MAKYLTIVSYTAEGLKGLMAKGGTARVEAAHKFVASAGGSVESGQRVRPRRCYHRKSSIAGSVPAA
jgi:uncharacterized protein with GYD domain